MIVSISATVAEAERVELVDRRRRQTRQPTTAHPQPPPGPHLPSAVPHSHAAIFIHLAIGVQPAARVTG
jgi:hypothetical protein